MLGSPWWRSFRTAAVCRGHQPQWRVQLSIDIANLSDVHILIAPLRHDFQSLCRQHAAHQLNIDERRLDEGCRSRVDLRLAHFDQLLNQGTFCLAEIGSANSGGPDTNDTISRTASPQPPEEERGDDEQSTGNGQQNSSDQIDVPVVNRQNWKASPVRKTGGWRSLSGRRKPEG